MSLTIAKFLLFYKNFSTHLHAQNHFHNAISSNVVKFYQKKKNYLKLKKFEEKFAKKTSRTFHITNFHITLHWNYSSAPNFSHLQTVFHFNRFTVPSLLLNNWKHNTKKLFLLIMLSLYLYDMCVCVCEYVVWRGKKFKFNAKWRWRWWWWWRWCQKCVCVREQFYSPKKKNMMIKTNWRNFESNLYTFFPSTLPKQHLWPIFEILCMCRVHANNKEI